MGPVSAGGPPGIGGLGRAADRGSVTATRRPCRAAAFRGTATFGATPDDLATLAELWALVRGWKGTRLEVDGAGVLPRERARVGGGPGVRRPGGDVLGAGRLLHERAGVTPGDDTGTAAARARVTTHPAALEHGVEWDQLARRMHQVRALLAERGIRHCPFLQLGAFEAALARWTARRAPASGHAPEGADAVVVETLHNDPRRDPIAPDREEGGRLLLPRVTGKFEGEHVTGPVAERPLGP